MSALESCVSSLRTSVSSLENSISILDSGVSDFPRLAKVLTTTRHFELVPESRLLAAQSALHDEIAPEVSSLLARVQTYLDRLERRENALRARTELLEGRLESGTDGGAKRDAAAAAGTKTKRQTTTTTGTKRREGPRDLKMHMLTQKKERLQYAVERLQLQAGQRERQLRKSVAAQ